MNKINKLVLSLILTGGFQQIICTYTKGTHVMVDDAYQRCVEDRITWFVTEAPVTTSIVKDGIRIITEVDFNANVLRDELRKCSERAKEALDAVDEFSKAAIVIKTLRAEKV